MSVGGKGSGGHNRKENLTHLLSGTFRSDRHGPKAAGPRWWSVPFEEPPVCPDWLDERGREYWRRNAGPAIRMRTLDELSLPLFECLCACYSMMRLAEETLQRDGLTIKDRRGEQAHPAHAMALRSSREVLKLSAEFGLTPSGRKRLGITWPPEGDGEDPLEGLLG